MSNKEIKAAYSTQLSEKGIFRGAGELVIGSQIHQSLGGIDGAIINVAKEAWENHPQTLYERRGQLGSWRLNSITEFERAAEEALADFPRSQEQAARIREQNAELLSGNWQKYKAADSNLPEERVATKAEIHSSTAAFKSWWEEVRGGNPNEGQLEQGETKPARQLFAIEEFLLLNTEKTGNNPVGRRISLDNRTHHAPSADGIYKIDLRMQMNLIKDDLNDGQSTGLTAEQYIKIQDQVATNSVAGEAFGIVYKIYKTKGEREKISKQNPVLSSLDFEGTAILDPRKYVGISQIITDNLSVVQFLKTEYVLTPQGFEKVVTYPRTKGEVKPLDKVTLPFFHKTGEEKFEWVKETMPLSPEDFLLVANTYLLMVGFVHKPSDSDGGSKVLVGVK